MTLAELERAALEAIETRKRLRAELGDAFDGAAEMSLVLRRRTEPRGNFVRLCGKGEFLASPADGEVLAMFKADEVLAWVRAERAKAGA